MKIILIGYMGSGKSTVGKILAKKLNIQFLDLDDEITQVENRSIPTIFSEKGEIYFRRRESEVLKECLQRDSSFVLALGGGTPCYANNLLQLKSAAAISIYLKLSLQELLARLQVEKEQRPLIAHLETPELLEDFIRKHLFERTYYYNQADKIIDCDGKSASEITEEIISKLA